MEQGTVQVTVTERNPQVGQTSKGKPKLGVKTAAGKWVQVTGDNVGAIQVGSELVIAEPKQFGKQWFADLKEIKIVAPQPSSNGNGQAAPRFDSRPKKLTWDEFERTYRAAHAMVMELEPDGYGPTIGESETKEGEAFTTPLTTMDRSAARATMMNTIVMSLTGKESGGMIEPAPEVPF